MSIQLYRCIYCDERIDNFQLHQSTAEFTDEEGNVINTVLVITSKYPCCLRVSHQQFFPMMPQRQVVQAPPNVVLAH